MKNNAAPISSASSANAQLQPARCPGRARWLLPISSPAPREDQEERLAGRDGGDGRQ
jgi:hypothetical protein